MAPREGDDQLSPEEITALSQAFSDGRAPRSSSEVRAGAEPVVLRYDLVGATSTQRHDYPALDLVHETFATLLGAELQRALRQEASFVARAPEILNFSEVYASLRAPSGVVVADVEGLACTGLVILDPVLLLHFVDLLMGGPGGATDAAAILGGRSFTATERHLITKLMTYVDRALAAAWREVAPVGLRMLRAEVDPRHAAVFNPSDRVADFRVEVAWDEVVGEIRLVVPMSALRSLEKRLARTAVTPPSGRDDGWRRTVRAALDDTEVTLTAVLGRTTLTLRELLGLEPGDLVRLDRDPEGPLDLLVEGVPKHAVAPTVRQGNLAVTLLSRLPPVAARGEAPAPDDDDDEDDDDPDAEDTP